MLQPCRPAPFERLMGGGLDVVGNSQKRAPQHRLGHNSFKISEIRTELRSFPILLHSRLPFPKRKKQEIAGV